MQGSHLSRAGETIVSVGPHSKSFLAAQAIEEFVNIQEWHMNATREGIAAVEHGEVASHGQAIAIL